MRNKPMITLSQTNIAAAAQSLKGRGTIELSDVGNTGTPPCKAVFIRSRPPLQWLIGHLSRTKSREAYADQVEAKLKQVLGDDVPTQLLQNIRTQIIKVGSLQGNFLARNLEALHNGGVLVPVGSKPGAAENKGQQVRIMTGSPMDIRADRCLVSFDTADEAMKTVADNRMSTKRDDMSAMQLGLWANKEGTFENDAELTFKFTAGFSSAKELLSFRGSNELHNGERNTNDMYQLIRVGIGKSTGAIVIEPQPDQMFKMKPVYTDAGLKAQIRAALDCKAEAKNGNFNRVITFASSDNALLQRVKALYTQVEKEISQAKSPDFGKKQSLRDSGNDLGNSDGFSDIDLNS